MAYDEDLDDKVDDEERHDEKYTEEGVESAEKTWPDDRMDTEASNFDPRYFDTEANPKLDPSNEQKEE